MTKQIINYYTKETCCKQIILEIDNDIILNVEFLGGCPGNLQGIKNLITGQDISQVAKKLKGITCGSKTTSCPDQLSQCLEQYISSKSAFGAASN